MTDRGFATKDSHSTAHSSLCAQVPLPEAHHGVVWTELDSTGLHGLCALIARIEAQDNPPYRTSYAEVVEMLKEKRSWKGLAGYATRGIAAGRMVAWAQVVLRDLGGVECMCQGGVDPAFRRIGLGGAVVEWQEAMSRAILSETDYAGPAQITMQLEPGQSELEEHLRLRGFHWARTYYELRAELTKIPPAPDLGRYLSIEPWGKEWEEPARHTSNLLSEIEWGRPPLSEDQWLRGRSAFEADWSFVLVDRRGDRPRVLGFLIASKYVQDWAALGWKEGYIDQMGVLESALSHRGVDALIIAAMTAMAQAGMDRIGTGLGSAHHSGTLAVYDNLGFATVGQTRLYVREV